jgi:Transposase IS4
MFFQEPTIGLSTIFVFIAVICYRIVLFAEETESCSDMRKLVLELCQPLFGTKRIVNMDNFYVSPQLLEQLYLKGLYARGTVRMSRKHTPKHLTFSKRDLAKYPRGSYRVGVCSEGVNRPIIFASWLDGSVVNILSNVDSTECTEIKRTHGGSSKTYEAPQVLQQYSKFMQGVDRVDQIRARFSIADGHTFKKWYKKLAMGLIDFARVNAYMAWKHAKPSTNRCERDLHRRFITKLSSELILGHWKSFPSNSDMFVEESESVASSASDASIGQSVQPSLSYNKCKAIPVSTMDKRRKRQCVICRWENRMIPTRTVRDITHNVSLCLDNKPTEYELKSYMCPNPSISCWKKFHEFYLPKKLYNARGYIATSCPLYKQRKGIESDGLKY